MAATLKVDTITNASNATGNANIGLDQYSNVTINGATLSPAASATNTGNIALTGTLAMGYSFKRNRIINGNMVIDQRNAGASVTPASGQYTLDRWNVEFSQNSKFSVQQNAGSVTPPAGFTNYLGATSLSAYTLGTTDYFQIKHRIEGYNVADLAWGTASAKTITISFWVYSSLTGTFSGCLLNSAANRSYAFSYTISALQQNQWVYQTITIPGDTSGTWLTNNGVGIEIRFNLGVGSAYTVSSSGWSSSLQLGITGSQSVVSTNGATWYITGVQLEVGSIATPYERQIYSDQLAQCQRYLPAFNSSGTVSWLGQGFCNTTTQVYGFIPYPVTVRTKPTGITISSASHFSALSPGVVTAASAVTFTDASSQLCRIELTVTGQVANAVATVYFNNNSGQLLLTGCEL